MSQGNMTPLTSGTLKFTFVECGFGLQRFFRLLSIQKIGNLRYVMFEIGIEIIPAVAALSNKSLATCSFQSYFLVDTIYAMDKQRDAESTTVDPPVLAQRSASPKISPRAQTPPTMPVAPTAATANPAPLVVNTAAVATSAAASPTNPVAAPSPRTPLRMSHSAGAIPSSRKASGGRSSPAMTEA
jgi:hypothetical protein